MRKAKSLAVIMWASWAGFLVNVVAKSAAFPDVFRRYIYNAMGMKIETKRIRPNVIIRGNNLTVKGNSLINYNCFMDASAPILIEDNVSLAFNVSVCTSTHSIGMMENRAGATVRQGVTIKRGSWIGASSTILPGVTIGEGCIVAAGAVVMRDCEPNGLYAGVPARRIKDLN